MRIINDTKVVDRQLLRQCHKCYKWKPLTAFYNDAKNRRGVRCRCKQCEQADGEIDRRKHGIVPHKDKRARRYDAAGNRLCYVCKQWKAVSDFARNPNMWDGYSSSCKTCMYSKNKLYRQTGGQQRDSDKRRLRYHTDINYRLRCNLRARIRLALKAGIKADKTMRLVGCDLSFLRKYIAIRFKPGMSWDNYTRYGWHIDHIIPCDAFDLSDPAQQRKCFHCTNLQPLWCIDNLRKGGIKRRKEINA